jgi:predicted transcriptional regulator
MERPIHETNGGSLPPTKSAILTEAELRIMNVLWGKGPSTVQQVLQALQKKPALAYNSVLTTVRILEKKGYVEHAKDGRAHVYVPLIGRQEASRSEIKHLVQRFFGSSQDALVLNILEERELDQEEIKRLQQMLAERPREEKGQ